ncbi:hypothetical protein BDF22DRAFT_743071 [Syncephalis plumigaleata]|nr:hypothetical protein BDF22DRAFT_743071 [Syncephalis plumigaleata]
MSLGRSLVGLSRRCVSCDQATAFSYLGRSSTSVASLSRTFTAVRSHEQLRSYYVSDPSRAAHPPPAPSPWGESLQVSAAESKAVAQDRFYALHRPLLSYQPVAKPRSIFITEEHDDDMMSMEYSASGKSNKSDNNALEALAEKCHYFQPFHPPQLTRPTTTPAIGRVLSPAADPQYWAQHDAIDNERDGNAIMEYRARADTFLKQGDTIIRQQMPATESTSTPSPIYTASIKRKRKLKMNKHKRRKLRKRTRALRKRLGKI